jgi:hypothetical protein
VNLKRDLRENSKELKGADTWNNKHIIITKSLIFMKWEGGGFVSDKLSGIL